MIIFRISLIFSLKSFKEILPIYINNDLYQLGREKNRSSKQH